MKFKYVPLRLSVEFYEEENELDEFHDIVDCPLPYKNLPNGEYLIRGSEKGKRKKYYNINQKWYLVEDIKVDNGHYYCDSTEYLLFPSLQEKEWVKIEAVGWKRLNKVWQRHLYGYKHWKHLERLGRNIRKDFLQFNREQ